MSSAARNGRLIALIAIAAMLLSFLLFFPVAHDLAKHLPAGPGELDKINTSGFDWMKFSGVPYLVSFGKLKLIEQEHETGRYALGPAALQLGLTCLHQLDPIRAALPVAQQLARSTGHAVALALWGNFDIRAAKNSFRLDDCATASLFAVL